MSNRNPTRVGQGHVVFKAVEAENSAGPDKGILKFHSSEVTTCFYTYPLKLMFPVSPYPSNCQWVYSLIYGGGLVSGDSFHIQVAVEPFCCVLMSTPSFTKVYQCEPGDHCQQHFEFHVASSSLLCILPDPVMCFSQADYMQVSNVYLKESGSVILLDWYAAGRISRGERWQFQRLKTALSLFIDKTLAIREALCLHGRNNSQVKEMMGAYNASGICILIGPLVVDHAKRMLDCLGQRESFGEKPEHEKVFAVSPCYHPDKHELIGCAMRFAAYSSSQVYSELERLLQPLFEVLGGNPFENKY